MERAWWPRRALDAVALAIIAFGCLQILAFGYGRDQGIYAVVSRVVCDGGIPYRDAWDFKPPGIFFTFALARTLFGSASWSIRLLECLVLCGAVGAMVHIGRRAWGDGRIGLVAGALTAVAWVKLDFWHTAQPETFGGLLGIMGLAAAVGLRPTRLALLFSGVLAGSAFLLKPPLAAPGVALGVELAIRQRSLRAPAWLAAGACAPVALCVGWFAAHDGYPALQQALFAFAPSYTALAWRDHGVGEVALEAARRVFSYAPAVILAGVPLVLARRAHRERLAPALLLAVALELGGVVAQGKLFAYHYGGIVPLLALVAALGYARFLQGRLRRERRRAALAIAASVALVVSAESGGLTWFARRAAQRLVWLGGGMSETKLADELATVTDVDAAANRAVASLLESRLGDDERVLVWGFEPVIHELSERRPASRFVYDVPLRALWSQDVLRPLLMSDLAATRPGAIVVEHGDRLPEVTGNDEDSSDTLETFGELRSLLMHDYGPAERLGRFDVYFRSESAPE